MRMYLFSTKACKPILVVTQHKIMNLKNEHNMSPLKSASVITINLGAIAIKSAWKLVSKQEDMKQLAQSNG